MLHKVSEHCRIKLLCKWALNSMVSSLQLQYFPIIIICYFIILGLYAPIDLRVSRSFAAQYMKVVAVSCRSSVCDSSTDQLNAIFISMDTAHKVDN